MYVCFDCIVFLQVMLVDGFKGQKVQDVKKPIQKMMVDRVCLFIYLFINFFFMHHDFK